MLPFKKVPDPWKIYTNDYVESNAKVIQGLEKYKEELLKAIQRLETICFGNEVEEEEEKAEPAAGEGN